jgi:hypothetical protein
VVREHEQAEDEGDVIREQQRICTKNPLCTGLAGEVFLAEAVGDLPLAAVVVTEDADWAGDGRRINRRLFRNLRI